MNIAISSIEIPADLLREGTPEVGDLLDSIPRDGLLQPILVRTQGGHTLLVSGKRRLTACTLLGHTHIEATVRDDMSEMQAIQAELVENLARRDLPAHREAEGVVRLIQLRFAERGMEVPISEVKSMLWKLSNEQRGRSPVEMTDTVEATVLLGAFDGLGRTFGAFVVGVLPAMSWPEDVRRALEDGLSRNSGQKLAQIKDDTLRKEATRRVQGGEKVADVKAELLGGVSRHKAQESDLSVAGRLEHWPTRDGVLMADKVFDAPAPSWSEAVPLALLMSELLARSVSPGGTVAMLNADLESVLSALEYGVHVQSVNAASRFPAELTSFDPSGADLVIFFWKPEREGEYSDEAEADNALLLKQYHFLLGKKVLIVTGRDLPTLPLPAGSFTTALVGVAGAAKTTLVTLALLSI